MRDHGASFGIGFVAGLRSLTACAALTFAAAQRRTRGGFIPSGPGARGLATAAALAEMAGDKMPFAPDRRILPSFAARLVIGAAGGWALAGRRTSPEAGALAGLVGAVAGTLIGRAARGPDSRTPPGRARGLAEDAAAVALAAGVVASAERRMRGV
ncbi:hypothetical protein VQ03_07935 [Methylobacterium tarhaniae]|uniref:DUF4126 domain-containing protein n=1 Tax=Methylobacterium tarhaniae TaxID=1187852 RepID=A0A0J6TD59_9HYPH|nr:hypothetical protein [Methylobacterium tarhaniae]KMO43538.1 hypothetical protein VQ03_07935 [Methylobacterium tarhaniae]